MTSRQVDTPQGHLAGPPVRALTRTYADGCVIPTHRHERGQLVYAVSGVMEMSALDRLWLIPPQRALWVPPGLDHRLRAMGTVELRTVFVHPEAIPPETPVRPTVVSVSSLLRELLVRAVSIPEAYEADGRDGLVMALILRELEWEADAPWCLPVGRDPRLVRVCSAILEHPDDNRTLADWGKTTGASARTLARLFAEETGLSFQHWRQQARVVLSLPRLAAGLSVTVVAADFGYETPGAFAAMFRRFTGQSPSRYFMSESA
jgi:AraC-like DNA-binding protein/quercetin dioxygenase-like cupin family protein